ncbi:MAG: tryptophan halogenase family protein [Sphingomonas sp.]
MSASGNGRPVRRVVIAGGGTAGWVTALTLSRHLGRTVEITLIESDEIGTVGVGEATIPTIRTFHRYNGIDEQAFLKATKASFKLAIAFENWGAVGERYIHSFGEVGRDTWLCGFQHMWLRAREEGFAGELDDYCLEARAAKAGKFVLPDRGSINYAYHLDAGLYSAFLRAMSEANGVRRVEGRIATVDQDGGSGFIDAVTLADGQRVEGDLFVDCTGFRGLLIEQQLGVGFEDWGHWLATDRAMAMQTEATGPAPPYTFSSAHEAGWRWRIPLQHRVGNGLVYCSEFMSDDAARERLLGAVTGTPVTEPRVIRYRTGRRLRVWEKNCVALGLSSGFVEPLESTSIHLIMIGAMRLLQNFPFNGINPALVSHYNDLAEAELEHVRDFVILHYHLTRRDDSPFWRRCRDMAIPDSLAERIALFRDDAQAYQAGDDLFRVDSWLQVMLGQGLMPRGYHPVARLITSDDLRGALASLSGGIAQIVDRMPVHQAFLDRYAA